MSTREELKKIPAEKRPLAQLVVAALATLPREKEMKMPDKLSLAYGRLRSISDSLEDLYEWLTTLKRPGDTELSDEQYEDPDRDDYYLRKTPLDLIREIEDDVDYVRKNIG